MASRLRVRRPARTVLLVAAIPCMIGGAISYQLNWSQERAAALDGGAVTPSQYTQLPVLPPLSLRLFGEHDAWNVLWAPGPPDTRELVRLRSLFPESVVMEQTRTSERSEEAEADLPQK